MFHLDLGLSALRSTQVALQTAGNNISNAATEGYHRQRVEFADRLPVTRGNLQLGAGVTVSQIRRLRDETVSAAIIRNGSASSSALTRLSVLERIDSMLTPGGGSLSDEATRLFDTLEQLSSDPTNLVLRRQVINAGQSVTRELNASIVEIDTIQKDLVAQARTITQEVNTLSAEIARLNTDIELQAAQGRQPNDLLDRRDAFISQLAQLMDLSQDGYTVDSDPFHGAGGMLMFGKDPVELRVEVNKNGELQIFSTDWDAPITPQSGKLAGLLEGHNQILTGTKNALLNWFQGLRSPLDQVQATGLGPQGPFSRLTSSQPVTSATTPLGSQWDLANGDLFVTMTETATGNRTTYRVPVNPAVDTLNDVIARLDAIPQLSAAVPTGSNKLTIVAGTGYKFDFAGRIDQRPDATGVTGTAVGTIGGQYTGSLNRNWQIVALDSGTIGVTSPLRLEVRDAATGNVLTTLNAGLGYEAGAPISLPDGLTLQLTTGSVNAGDTWGVAPVANPDTAGITGALGLRSFFTGTGEGPFGVHPDLVSDPLALATSRSGQVGDTTNLARFIAVRNVNPGGAGTIEDRLAQVISAIGLDVQATRAESEQIEAIGVRLAADRDAVSGVDVNEEMLTLLRSQQLFQSATRFITTVEQALDELLEIVR